MKILFPYLSRWHSANRSRYHQLLTHLGHRGHRIFVMEAPPIALDDISSRDITTADGDLITLPAGLEIVEMRAPSLLRPLWQSAIPRTKLLKKAAIAISSLGEVERFISHQRIDLLFLYNLPQLPLIGRTDCHVHFDLADDLVAMLEGEDRLLFRLGGRQLAAWLQQRMVTGAHTVSVASEELARTITRPGLLLPNGADIAFLDGIAPAGRQDQSARTDSPVAGFVGAFEYWVDIDLLLAVAERLPHWHFLLAGGGRRLADLCRRVAERRLVNIELTGPLPYTAAMRRLAGVDVCLLPFIHSAVANGSCPLKLFEYAALRRPIVSTRTSEVERLGRGWIAFADDPESFAAAIERWRLDPPAPHTSIDQGRHLVETSFNWPVLAARFESFIAESRSHRGAY